MNRRLLVIIGNPIPGSLAHALADGYAGKWRAAGAEVRVIDLAHDPIPAHPHTRDQLRMPRPGHRRPSPRSRRRPLPRRRARRLPDGLPPAMVGHQPAALKAFIDRVFLAGAAFRYRERSALSDRSLRGRTARIVMTMDSPRLWNRLAYRGAAEASLARATFGYCGIRTIGITRHTPIRFSDEATRSGWIAAAARHGRVDAASPSARRGTTRRRLQPNPPRTRQVMALGGMKTWIVRFVSLYVFNVVVLLVIGLLTPAHVGWAVLWSAILTRRTLREAAPAGGVHEVGRQERRRVPASARRSCRR